ncbi:SDR family NAD(P)-dependent oxidoreductase [Ethanoligenens sp.]|uniref:SDR family NAD(P)-dependent oxidoreductase n=1 Tax=Ethanoligenens sp. TaxID=2099655 RepID=UPI0039EA3B84
MNPDGKVIILTGASSGIGRALLERLQRYNADIIAVSRHIGTIPNHNARVVPYTCDVSKKEEVDRLFSFAVDKFGKVDLFIANAGFAYCEELNTADWGHIENIFRTNVFSPIYSFEKMKELNRGRKYTVVMTCSAVSRIPLPGYALYCATKAAIEHFAHTYFFERNDKGVLTLVFPVATATKFFNKAGDSAPVPLPVHPPSWVAACIMAGIHTDCPVVFPSPTHMISYFTINRIFPFIYGIYDLVNAVRFRSWAKRHQNSKPSDT